MKHKNVHEDCKKLVSYGEARRESSISEHKVYVDSFGCDLQVYCSNILYRGLGKMRESVNVYFGGRRVCSFSEDRIDRGLMVKGHWKKLVTELWRYELATYLGESYNVNGTLLELCRKESAKNRENLNKYCRLCVTFAKRNGTRTESEISRRYRFKDQVDGHNLEVCLMEMMPKDGDRLLYDYIELYFDGKIVFDFHYNCNVAGNMFDEKGEYSPGEWERIVEKF